MITPRNKTIAMLLLFPILSYVPLKILSAAGGKSIGLTGFIGSSLNETMTETTNSIAAPAITSIHALNQRVIQYNTLMNNQIEKFRLELSVPFLDVVLSQNIGFTGSSGRQTWETETWTTPSPMSEWAIYAMEDKNDTNNFRLVTAYASGRGNVPKSMTLKWNVSKSGGVIYNDMRVKEFLLSIDNPFEQRSIYVSNMFLRYSDNTYTTMKSDIELYTNTDAGPALKMLLLNAQSPRSSPRSAVPSNSEL